MEIPLALPLNTLVLPFGEAEAPVRGRKAEAVEAGVGTPDIYPNAGYTTQDVAAAIVARI